MVIFDTRVCIVVIYSFSASTIVILSSEFSNFRHFTLVLVLFGVKLNV